MSKIHLTNLQVGTLCFFLLNSFTITIGYNYLTNISNTDVIIDIIIGTIVIIIYFLGINFIRKKNSNKCLITTIKSYPILKWFLLPLLSVILFITIIYTLNIITSFINYYILKEVNSLVIMITLIITILYLIKKEISTITKVSEILFYFYLLFIFISWLGLFNNIDFTNLKPLFTINISSHLNSILTYSISIIIPIFLITMIPQNCIKGTKKTEKYPLFLLILASILILSEFVLIISVLGIQLTNVYQNPDMIIYKKISFLNILDRVEVLLAFNNILNSFFILTMCFYTLTKIINNVFPTKKENITLSILGVLIFFLTISININKTFFIIANIFCLIIFIILLIKSVIDKYNHH